MKLILPLVTGSCMDVLYPFKESQTIFGSVFPDVSDGYPFLNVGITTGTPLADRYIGIRLCQR